MGPDSQGGGTTQLYASIIAIAVVVAIVVWRNRRPQKLRMERLWVRPMRRGSWLAKGPLHAHRG